MDKLWKWGTAIEMSVLLAEIDRKKAVLDSRRPLPAATVDSIRQAMRLEWTYHSNALEGNTLTLREQSRWSPAISGSRHLPPPPSDVAPLMRDLFDWYDGEGARLHPVERAAIHHHRFAYVHPSVDGNGRTARCAQS